MKDIIPEFNQGHGFVYFVGHGSPMMWNTYLPNNKNRIRGLGIFQMLFLRNQHRLPICVSTGCNNLQFDVSIFKFFNKTYRRQIGFAPECWGWVMTHKRNGGSVATIGCTAIGYGHEDKNSPIGGINELELNFFYQIGQNHTEILGDAWKKAITWYTHTYDIDWNNSSKDFWIDTQVPQTWILFGDPSLKIGGYPNQ